MKSFARRLSFIAFATSVLAHGGHHDSPGPEKGETIQEYAQRHMSKEHHIDSFDLPSFFQLHDLDGDGVWSRAEIEAIYGVHHVYSQKKSKDDVEHQKKADTIVETVLEKMDTNKDGEIALEEFVVVGLTGLPNFDNLGAEGHHYDIESEFFLHHEEEFHSTPETQTDESYNHPRTSSTSPTTRPSSGKRPRRRPSTRASPRPRPQPIVEKKPTRQPPPEKQDPSVRFAGAKDEAGKMGEWGSGEEGYKTR
ncbi:hypothetical protein BD626DRAFT_549159 [Schizophyllum amplum]|uniref:EF-hand domain-containing protein n=1 Tax=Schizophyllum amplum TaxID=97359 RepID=A0A550C9W1_9AGAR|nr:hypothetical protein BD626DRAFT_549159 [Auriculariopsis ampla]